MQEVPSVEDFGIRVVALQAHLTHCAPRAQLPGQQEHSLPLLCNGVAAPQLPELQLPNCSLASKLQPCSLWNAFAVTVDG